MITRVQFSIDDTHWPKLHIAGVREDTRGGKVAFEMRVQYDLAYSQFENAVHNALRPAVQEIIERRQRSQ